MFQWLQSNLPTIIVGLIVFCVLAFAIYRMVKANKSGTSSCGCGCSGCAINGSCHPDKKK